MPKARSKVSRKRKFYGKGGLPRNRIINFQALMGIISILCCPECYATGLKLAEDSRIPWKHGSIEAVRIFERSLIKRDLQYTEYYGDGDSKGFLQVKDIYGESSVTKLECIGHIQKRVGSRLRRLKKNTKGLEGKGKLTDKFMDKLQNYYGIAIRSNVGCLEKMQSAVIAAFFHCCSSNQNLMPGQCPTGKDSWCKYKQALCDGKHCDPTEKRATAILTSPVKGLSTTTLPVFLSMEK
ncbi:uncharacterized protein TNCV_1750171 [Trichonephila clavipes]|nr:uncharacterized protein TNCV_1750171 [Trichonephila clavipes]